MPITYSNARNAATFEDWPHGKLRTRCTFTVETVKGKGQRVARVTVDPKTGRESKPKLTTFARRAAIVDGDDGRTYVASLTMYGFVQVLQSNLIYQAEVIHEPDPRQAELRAAIEALPQG